MLPHTIVKIKIMEYRFG